MELFPADRPAVVPLDERTCLVSDGDRLWLAPVSARELLLGLQLVLRSRQRVG